MRICLLILIFFISSQSPAQITHDVAINIITYQPTGFRVDDTAQGQRVRRIFQKIKELGVDTLIFNFRAQMITGVSSDIRPDVQSTQQADEETLLKQTITYAKSLGFKIAFRPILLVVGPHGEFPYTDNSTIWWHGNIRPTNVPEWFDHFFAYHQRYMRIAQEAEIAWYSIGAEMHSMTSGLGSRDPSWRFGFPALWVDFISKARQILGPQIQITYGANYTDQYVLEEGTKTWGGEFAQWTHDLTFTPQSAEEERHQNDMRALWKSLDFVGLDYYRALGSSTTDYPKEYSRLIPLLNSYSQNYAQNIDANLQAIDAALKMQSALALQEVGYRSVEKCFVSPYLYEDDHTPINYEHQAAAWDALLMSLWIPEWSWLKGLGIWQVLLDDDSDQIINGGFSPLGKDLTENVLRKYFLTHIEPPVKNEVQKVHATHTNSVPAQSDLLK